MKICILQLTNKMGKGFNLSKRRITYDTVCWEYKEEDVKKFIEKIKKELCQCKHCNKDKPLICSNCYTINYYAGDKLIAK